MSNLTLEKGLDEVIDLLLTLHARNVNVKLIIAGPYGSNEARLIVEEAIRRYPEVIKYQGAIYGEDKIEFYKRIDVFVFPTHYQHETEGIVTLDALAHGVPVIAYARGCIPERICEGTGILVSSSENFIEAAAEYVCKLVNVEGQYQKVSKASYQQANHLHKQAQNNLKLLIDSIT